MTYTGNSFIVSSAKSKYLWIKQIAGLTKIQITRNGKYSLLTDLQILLKPVNGFNRNHNAVPIDAEVQA